MRRVELDTYLAIISDLALTYGGALFYEYHKSFSSKAAMYIQKFNQRIDWSVVDLNLISRHFTGHPPLTCSVCGSFSHSLTCVLRLHPRCARLIQASRIRAAHITETGALCSKSHYTNCIQFNKNVCTYPKCKYLHICSWCADSHPRSVCPRRTRPTSKPGKQ